MNTVDMTKGSPIKLLIRFSIPILIGNLFQQAYTLADRIIVGRFVGDTAFSAIGATNAMSMAFMSMCMGAAIGTGVVVSQYFGAKDEKGTAAAIANGSYTCALIAVIMTAIALLTTKPILHLLNTPESLMPDATTYLYIFMGGLIAVAAYFTPFSILRALGDSKTPLVFLVLCSLLNIGLDFLFVVTFRAGVAGAAFATVLSEALAAILCMIYAFRKVSQFKQAFHHRKVNKNLIAKTCRVGIPNGLQYALIYVSSIVLQGIVNGFGESVIGAGKQDRISGGIRAAMEISAVVSVILLAVFWVFGKPIMSIFVTNEEIISIAANGIRITSLFFMGLGGVQILRYMLNGAGDSMYALMNGIVEVAARVLFAISLTMIPFIGMWGIWLTTGLTWAVTAVFALIRYKHGAWKSKKLV